MNDSPTPAGLAPAAGGVFVVRWMLLLGWLFGAGSPAVANDLALAGATVICDGAPVTFEALGAPVAGRLNASCGDSYRQVCPELDADGWHVFPVDGAAGFDPANAQTFHPDLLHPSDAGHARIATLFLSAVHAEARRWGVSGMGGAGCGGCATAACRG